VVHANAPLTPTGRLRLVRRCEVRPIAHVAAEAGVSRQCLSTWKARFDDVGEAGLVDRSSAPRRSPRQLDEPIVARIEGLRRTRKWSARLIAAELTGDGVPVSVATVGRWLARLGLNRRRFLDTDGEPLRVPGKIVARNPRAHDPRGREEGRADPRGRGLAGPRPRLRSAPGGRPRQDRRGPPWLHLSALRGRRVQPPGYTEPLGDETARTAIGFWTRARAFFTAHGIARITRVVTDNGACYRAGAFTRTLAGSRHQQTRPYTPRHNGKVERYNRILSEELLYARPWTSDTQRSNALATWLTHYNYHRPQTATADQPPASRLYTGVTNVKTSNS